MRIFIIIVLFLLVPAGAAYGAVVIFPQFEKIPEDKQEWLHDVRGEFAGSNHAENNQNGHDLNQSWVGANWKSLFSVLGILLPAHNDPDNRNPDDFIRRYDGACDQDIEAGIEPSRGCRHQVGLSHMHWGKYYGADMAALASYDPVKTWMPEGGANQNVFHERALVCENPEKAWLKVYGSLDNYDQGTRQKIEASIKADTELYLHLIENNLPQHYKDSMKHHILNATYLTLDTAEYRLIHPDGVNCNLD